MTYHQGLRSHNALMLPANPTIDSQPCYAVVLCCSKNKIEELEKYFIENEIEIASIREPDPPFDNDLLAIGVEPHDREEFPLVRKATSQLKLYR